MTPISRIFCVAACAAVLAGCASPDSVRLPPAPSPGEPSDLTGMSAARLRAAYGAPAFVRRDGDAQMWRYDSDRCKAFFFLYSEDSVFKVRHVETLPRGSLLAADLTCLDALRARASTPVS